MLLKIYLGLIQHVFRIGSWLVRGYLGLVGRVSGFSKAGLMIYLRLVPGWFRMFVGLVCGLFGMIWGGLGWGGLYRVASCLFDSCSLGLIWGWFIVPLGVV